MGGDSPKSRSSQSVIINGQYDPLVITQCGSSNQSVMINSCYRPAFVPPPIHYNPPNYLYPYIKQNEKYFGNLNGKKVRFDIVK